MRSIAPRISLLGCALGALAALAPAALAQTSIADNRTGGAGVNTLFTVQLRDASGKLSGQAIVDHPRMGLKAELGTVPQAQLAKLERAVIAADLLVQPAREWTGEAASVGTETYTDQNGDYCTLLPMTGPRGVDARPEMLALEQAMDAALAAFVPAGTKPPAPTPLLSYTFASTTIGNITLDVATDGTSHLHGAGARYNGIDMTAQLPAAELASLKAFLLRLGPTFDGYSDFGQMNYGGAVASITYTDASGNAKTVRHYSGTPGAVWSYLETFLRTEAVAIDPKVTF